MPRYRDREGRLQVTSRTRIDRVAASTPSGGGTVTAITGGPGVAATPATITTTGSLALDIDSLPTALVIGASDFIPFLDSPGTTPADAKKITFADFTAGITASPADLDGSVQYNNGGVFGGQSTKFYWDDINFRLGLLTDTPSQTLDVDDLFLVDTATRQVLVDSTTATGTPGLLVRSDINAGTTNTELWDFQMENSLPISGAAFRLRGLRISEPALPSGPGTQTNLYVEDHTNLTGAASTSAFFVGNTRIGRFLQLGYGVDFTPGPADAEVVSFGSIILDITNQLAFRGFGGITNTVMQVKEFGGQTGDVFRILDTLESICFFRLTGTGAADGGSNVSIGEFNVVALPDARLHIRGVDTSSALDTLLLENSTPAVAFRVRNDRSASFPVSLTVGSDTVGTEVLEVIGNGLFTGDLDIQSVPYDWPVANAAGVLTNDGFGTLTWSPAGGPFQPLDADLTEIAAVANVRGDLLVTNAGPTWVALGIGVPNRVLRSDGTDPSWAQVDLTTDVTGTLPLGSGGTGVTTAAALAGLLDHNLLLNLPVGDVHTQYVFHAGRATGQTIHGGTVSGETLILRSNTANDDRIILGDDPTLDSSVVIHGTTTGMSIGGVAHDTHLVIHDEDPLSVILSLHKYNAVPTTGAILSLARADGITSAPTIVSDNFVLGRIVAHGYDGTDYERAARITFEVDDATPSPTSMGGAIVLETTPAGSTTLVERLRIAASGGVTATSLAGAGTRLVTADPAGLLATTPTTTFQPLDAGLTALASLGAGIAVSDGADGWFARSLVAPAAGLTITPANGVAGNPTFALANDLAALEALTGIGFAVRTSNALEAWTTRSITSNDTPTLTWSITNASGLLGNPILSADVDPSGISHSGLGDFTGDDHTQYLLLAGRTGTGNDAALTTSAGGTGILAGGTPADANLRLRASSSGSTHTGYQLLADRTKFWTDVIDNPGTDSGFIFDASVDFDAGSHTIACIDIMPTFNLNTGLASAVLTAFRGRPTINCTAGFNQYILFQSDATVNLLGGTPPLLQIFSDATLVQASAGFTIGNYRSLIAQPVFKSNTATGAVTVTNADLVYLQHILQTTDAAAVTALTTARGIRILNPSVGAGGTTLGTEAIDNFIGVDVEAQTRGTTSNIAFRSQIASAAGRWSFLGTGTADSSLAGRLFVGGAASTVPNTDLDVDGDLATRAADLALATGVNNDIAIGARSYVRITGPGAAFSISSIANPFDGKRVILVNTTAFVMTITNAAGTGTAANRILTTTGANVATLHVELIYDATTQRWRQVG